MDVSAFYTRTASPPPGAPGSAALQNAGIGAGAPGGVLGFLDLLFSTLGKKDEKGIAPSPLAPPQNQSKANAKTDQARHDSKLSVEDLLKALEGSLDAATLADLRAALTTLVGDVRAGEKKSDLLGVLQGLIEKKSETDPDLAAALLNALAEPGTPAPQPGLLSANTADEKTAGEETSDLASLLTANLTPEQIADLAQRLSRKADALERGGVAFLTALLSQNAASADATAQGANANTPPSVPKPAQTPVHLAAPAGSDPDAPQTQNAAITLAQTIARIVEETRAAAKGRREARFADLLLQGATELSGASVATVPGGAPSALSALKNLPHPGKDAASNLLSSLSKAEGIGGLQTTLSPDDALSQWLERLTAPMSAGAPSAPAPTGASTGASVLNGAHPASQIVAAAMLRATQGGETKTLTVTLDPPELGRVAVRMEMGRDRSIKAVLSVEKPEALSVLQRDSHLLERALQNAGFETGGESLTFELAQDGGAFDHGAGGHGTGHGEGSGTKDHSGEDSVIETKMTWFIDPHTGAQRYNLYV